MAIDEATLKLYTFEIQSALSLVLFRTFSNAYELVMVWLRNAGIIICMPWVWVVVDLVLQGQCNRNAMQGRWQLFGITST